MATEKASAAHITGELAGLLERDRWLPGDRLPSEAELMARYNASRPTVRKALTNLAGAGMVESRHGAGWFVCNDRRERFALDAQSHEKLTANDDVWHSWVASIKRVASHRLEVHIEEPPRDVVRLLKIEGTERLAVARRRIRSIDGEPWMISTGWWPMWIASGTPLAHEGDGDSVDMRDPSPLKFAAHAGYPALREENEITSRMPLESEAATLRMSTSLPLLTMHTTSWTHEDRPLRCTADIFPSNRFMLTLGRTRD